MKEIKIADKLCNGGFYFCSVFNRRPTIRHTFERILFKLFSINKLNMNLSFPYLGSSTKPLRLVHGPAVSGNLGIGGTQERIVRSYRKSIGNLTLCWL